MVLCRGGRTQNGAPQSREVSHSLLNLAERDGRASYPQFTARRRRSEEHTSELQSQSNLVCRLLLGKKKIRYEWHTCGLPSQSKLVWRLVHGMTIILDSVDAEAHNISVTPLSPAALICVQVSYRRRD